MPQSRISTTVRWTLGASFSAMLCAATVVGAQSAPCDARASGQASLVRSAAGDSARSSLSRADTGAVDVVIFAAASAREVRFASRPDIRVRLCGGLDSVHVIERRNLPDPVVAGTTYRDVYVSVEIFGRLAADCLARQLRGAGAPGGARRDSSRTASLDCASLELRGTNSARPPTDSAKSFRR